MSQHEAETSENLKIAGVSVTGRRVVGVVIAVVALIFVFSNTGQVNLNFLWIGLSAPGWVMLLILLMAGFIAGLVFGRKRYKPAKPSGKGS